MQKRVFMILALLMLFSLPLLAQADGCSHDYAWVGDESGCYKECSLCGDQTSKSAHKEFCPSDGVCDNCGYAAQNISVYHAYDVYAGFTEKAHLMQCAGCGNTMAETHYGTCSQAGCAQSDCTYENQLDDALHNVQHAFSNDYTHDDTHHWLACSGCGDIKDETEHDFRFSHVVVSTCQDIGYEMFICTCGAEKRVDFTQLGTHSYDVTETPASCEKKGSRVMVCIYCGDTLVDTFPALNHAWDNYDRDLPTCTEPGMTYYRCDLCGDRLKEPLPARAHRFDPIVVGDEIFSACYYCGIPEDEGQTDYLLLYRVKPDRYGTVRLNLSDNWTEESYAACRLVLLYDDGTQEEAPFAFVDGKLVFNADNACTAAFAKK